MKQTKATKTKKNKAGFGSIHVVLILMFTGFSATCVGDIVKTVAGILLYKGQYQEAQVVLEEKKSELEDLNLMVAKMNDPDYIKVYLRGKLYYSAEGETVFITRDNK